MRDVMTNAEMQSVINAGHPVLYKGKILRTIPELPSDSQILLDYPLYAYTRIEGNARGILGYGIYGVPTDGDTLVFDDTNGRFNFAAGGSGGGSGTVGSGLAKRLSFYSSNGTTLDDAAGLEYQTGASPNFSIEAQDDTHTALLVTPFSNAYSEYPIQFLPPAGFDGVSFLFEPSNNIGSGNLRIKGGADFPSPSITIVGATQDPDNGLLRSGINIFKDEDSSSGIRIQVNGSSWSDSDLTSQSGSTAIISQQPANGSFNIIATNNCITRFAVGGADFSSERFAIQSDGIRQYVPSTALSDDQLLYKQIHFYLDETGHTAQARWKESSGDVFSTTLGGGGASTALDNLSSVAINTNLYFLNEATTRVIAAMDQTNIDFGGDSITIKAGAALGVAQGGQLRLLAGDGGDTSGNGGALQMESGSAQGDGAGGQIDITAGGAQGSSSLGGQCSISGGSGSGTGDGGTVYLVGGNGGAGGSGGNSIMMGGNGGATEGNGGSVSLQGGSGGADGDGGIITITSGGGGGSGVGGDIEITAAFDATNTTRGDVNVIAEIINLTANSLTINSNAGASGTFTSQDGKTVTVTNGIITSIV